MTQQNNILNAADYADALLTAKRGKNIVFPLLLLMLLLQLAIFFVGRYSKVLNPPTDPNARNWLGVLEYLTGMIDFFGIVFALLYAAILCLIMKVLLLGRLLGVGRVTSALIWSFLFVLLLFPWQSFLNNPSITNDPMSNSIGLKLVGALYTWAEFTHPTLGAHFSSSDVKISFLRWTRFVAAPVAAVLILMIIQAKSSRGLRQALGNDLPMPLRLPTA